MESKIDKSTDLKMKELGENMKKNKEYALKKLLDMVLQIEPELHINYKK